MINQFATLSEATNYWIHRPRRRATGGRSAPAIRARRAGAGAGQQAEVPMDFTEVTELREHRRYGSDRLRFPAIVPSGCKIHGRYRIKSVEQLQERACRSRWR